MPLQELGIATSNISHNWIGHNWIGHNRIGHNYIGNTYAGHIHIGNNYIGHDCMADRVFTEKDAAARAPDCRQQPQRTAGHGHPSAGMCRLRTVTEPFGSLKSHGRAVMELSSVMELLLRPERGHIEPLSVADIRP